jgi:hypothetical protein
LEHWPVAESHAPAVWHASSGWQAIGLPAHEPTLQVYCWHLSAPVHAVPSVAFGFEQVPVAGSHVPVVWHASSGSQVIGVPAVQTPAVQASPLLQALPVLQPVPSVAAGFEHSPLVGSQLPAVWH